MALSPVFKMNDTGDGLTKVRAHRQAHSAVTKYKVLDSSSGCSIVELQPLTSKSFILFGMKGGKKYICVQLDHMFVMFVGAKHQMRVHMAFGLMCPILGDHKYSHWNQLAPQVIHSTLTPSEIVTRVFNVYYIRIKVLVETAWWSNVYRSQIKVYSFFSASCFINLIL